MKGSAWAWMTFLIMFFIIVLVYNIWTYVLGVVEPPVQSYIGTTNSTIATNGLATLGLIDVAWKYWPIFLLVGLIIWVFASSARREGYYGGDQ
jgi:hypothetical protein